MLTQRQRPQKSTQTQCSLVVQTYGWIQQGSLIYLTLLNYCSPHACLKAVFSLPYGFQLILCFWSHYLIMCIFYFLLWFMGNIHASLAAFSCSVNKSYCPLSDLMSSLPCLQVIKTATTLLDLQNNWMRCLLLGSFFSFTDFPTFLHFTDSNFILAV